MKEIIGDMWCYDGRKGFILLITTNGYIKNDKTAVMGRGNAREAAEQYPDLPRLLGKSLGTRGNVVSRLLPNLFSFPVKHEWMDDADLKLIKKSTEKLKELALSSPSIKFILPRPGVGNGNLKWKHVKPIVDSLPDNVWVITKDDNG